VREAFSQEALDSFGSARWLESGSDVVRQTLELKIVNSNPNFPESNIFLMRFKSNSNSPALSDYDSTWDTIEISYSAANQHLLAANPDTAVATGDLESTNRNEILPACGPSRGNWAAVIPRTSGIPTPGFGQVVRDHQSFRGREALSLCLSCALC
jgi:hypothetical protein